MNLVLVELYVLYICFMIGLKLRGAELNKSKLLYEELSMHEARLISNVNKENK